MTHLAVPIRAGILKSSRIILLLVKIIVPVSCVVFTMKYFNILEPVAEFFAPLMSLLGLPGDAALALAFGFFVSVYAAIGVITTLTLTTAEMTILAVMIGISHELFVETAISSHTGLKMPAAIALRMGAALIAGLLMNLAFTLLGVV